VKDGYLENGANQARIQTRNKLGLLFTIYGAKSVDNLNSNLDVKAVDV